MPGKSNQTQLFMTIAVIILISAGLIFFVILPLLLQIEELNLEIQKAQRELIQLAEEVQGYKTVIAELARVEDDREAITKAFPNREEMLSLVEGLETAINIANLQSSLTITDELENPPVQRRPGEVTPPLVRGLKQIQEIPYVLELNGNYRGVVDYFLYFDNLPFVSEVSKLTITADTIQDDLTKTVRNIGSATSRIEGTFFIRTK